jgi:hypothetical protein
MIDPIQLVNATTACLEALSILASPIVFTRHRKDAERRKTTYDVGARLLPLLDLLPKRAADPNLARLADDVAEIRGRIASLPSPHDIDRSIVEAARAALVRFGIPEPPGGWDRSRGR